MTHSQNVGYVRLVRRGRVRQARLYTCAADPVAPRASGKTAGSAPAGSSAPSANVNSFQSGVL